MIGDISGLNISTGVVGALLVAGAAALGFYMGRRRGEAVGPGSSPPVAGREAAATEPERVDRRQILGLLKNLGEWTEEYRGGVSQYQSELGEIHTAVSQGSGADAMVGGVVPLLERIMEANQQLQTRLEAAEDQLADQTRQLETYLSEARTDALTGLANRRAFDEQLDELWEKARRGGNSFVLALVDLDHFKVINDTYGHQVGDAVLREVSQRMSDALRESLLVARFGGEEFAVLMPAPLRGAAETLDRFRKGSAAAPIQCDGHRLEVTLSAGLAEGGAETSPERLIQQADEALYAAKGIGRNRVYFHNGESPALYGAPEIPGHGRSDGSMPTN